MKVYDIVYNRKSEM